MKKSLGSVLLCAATLAASLANAGDDMRAAQGQVVFAQNCHACHSEDSSKNTFGPSLTGVVGRQAGSLPRFAYSDALRAAGFSWTEEKLRLWVQDNEALVPGTRMRHVAITDKAEQDYLIAYLKTL
ncbi:MULTISPECIES: c-type cytochrome [unclassified Oceanobacter]|jgi:cytochrome c|uniref:c-type cytochrome n=1 Tax=unclassified Oceanobacter TaxID=2620260 RepID=UPI0026E3FAE2|nr:MULTISPECIES: c-type cytochrome [unclassified Oceanobacter]MDO6682193.1 c-type cytochrome [Oceanobacter sp. 5_MG-2023]MDP2504926.1 c-type cytochrome [Oceanobacter sp. 3_MG-2023]MDP2546370.1 c-type cytochrome [Oceanobacter sp. 4_MG-2023]MDP2610440.1 c-type cytochrome [Oceanobacter sp. 1_MG-2023]MDP2613676.1 c-type cytochrome [Oceanobacter sp. 2_MG-2023]